MKRSIVEYCAEHEKSRCGYCKRTDSNFNHGMWAHTLTVTDYQDLIDRGWRRSGKYCYKPTMDATCCPMYTIRCRPLEFKPTKSQKKVLKKFNKYLMGHDLLEKSQGDRDRKMSTCSSEKSDDIEDGIGQEMFVESTKVHQDIDISKIDTTFREDNKIQSESTDEGRGDCVVKEKAGSSSIQIEVETHKFKKGVGPDPNKGPCKKAKQLRIERKLEKLKEKGIDLHVISNSNKNKAKELEAFINEMSGQLKHKLELRLVRTCPPSPEWLASARETHEVYVKYQMAIHGDRLEKCSESRFQDFLVHSPLIEEYSERGPECGYGSFHQQYWLDGKIIAVGVVDILPKCLSSVYFFYDPMFTNLTLGTYGALREISFTRYLHSQAPELQYYYMGFYIHSCRKMRYKGNFHPSDLLCPETYKWFPIKSCLPKLEVTPYSRLDTDLDSIDENSPREADVNNIPILSNGAVIPYKIYRRKNKEDDDEGEVMDYSRLVGAKTAKSLILVK